MRDVVEALVLRVRVDRRHEAGLDPAELVQHLRERRDTVRRAGGVRDDVMRVRVVLVVVHAEHDRDVRIRRRSGDDDLLRTRVEMLLRSLAIGEEPGRLEHDIDAEVSPRKRRRVALGEHPNLLTGRAQDALGELDLALERAEIRVVAQEVRHRLRVPEIVQRDDLDVRAERVLRAEEVPPDAAEPVDAHPSAHPSPPSSATPYPRRRESRWSTAHPRELLQAAEAPMHRRLRRGRVGATRQLAQGVRRVTKPQLRGLAQAIRQVGEHALGAEPLRPPRADGVQSGSSARGWRDRRSRAGSPGIASRRRPRAPRARERSRRLPSGRAATRSPPSSSRTRRRGSRARTTARSTPLVLGELGEPGSSRPPIAVRSSRCGERRERRPTLRRETRRAGTRRGSRSERRLCAAARSSGAWRRSTTPASVEHAERVARRRRRAAGSASRGRMHAADTCGSRSGSRCRAEARTRAALRRRSRDRDAAPSRRAPAGAGCRRSERGRRARPADRTRAAARCVASSSRTSSDVIRGRLPRARAAVV